MVNYKLDRQDLGYLPSEGEHLEAYVARLTSVLQQSRYAYSPNHEKWYTHYGSAPCWICNVMDCADYLAGIMQDIVKNDKKRKWVCERPVGTQDVMAFNWIPKPR